MKRAAIYIRMSTDEQEESPERQRSQTTLYCERCGYNIFKVYEDLGMRGWDSTRPQFQAMLRDADANLIDIIVVDELSRLSRMDAIEFFSKVASPLRNVGVSIDTVAGGPLDWNDLPGLLMVTIGQHTASAESVTLSRRTATGMLNKAMQGKMFPGQPPYSYRYIKDNKSVRIGLELDADHPEKARVVRQIFDAYLNRDLSLMAIVSELNSLGIASPRGRNQWGKTTVHRILTNHAYAGSYVWGKVPQGRYYRCNGKEVVPTTRDSGKSHRSPSKEWLIIPDQHEPIVDPVLFDKTQECLAMNRIRTSPSRKKGSYPLSQVLICNACGSPLYGAKIYSGGRWVPTYRCGNDMSRGKCGPRAVREAFIIEKLAEVLQERLLDPRERERLEAELRRQREQPQDQGHIEALRRKVTKFDSQIARAEDNLLELEREYLPRAQTKIREMKAERSAAQAEVERLIRRSPSVSAENLIARVEKLVELMRSGTPSLVRSVLRETIGRVDLRFDEVRKAKLTRYPLAGGIVHLIDGEECADSSTSGRAAAR